jgi:hypothetical protein
MAGKAIREDSRNFLRDVCEANNIRGLTLAACKIRTRQDNGQALETVCKPPRKAPSQRPGFPADGERHKGAVGRIGAEGVAGLGAALIGLVTSGRQVRNLRGKEGAILEYRLAHHGSVIVPLLLM